MGRKGRRRLGGRAAILSRSQNPFHNTVCFLCQQCIEKYLKAKLNEAGIFFTKTHNLEDLLKLVTPVEPGWAVLQP
jgi:HEPN domain-containing protein